MHAQTTTTPAQAQALADEAMPIAAAKVMAAGLAGPTSFTPAAKSRVRLVNINRIYPAELKARVDKLAAIDTMNGGWPDLLQKMDEVSPAAGAAARLQFKEEWDLDLAAEAIIVLCGKAEDETQRSNQYLAICEQYRSRQMTRYELGYAARRWIDAFRANGGSFVWGEGAARGTYRDIAGTTPRQHVYTNDLLKLAFPVDDAGQALPSPLGDAIWTEVEAEVADPVSIAAE